MKLLSFQTCPLCDSKKIAPFLTCRDTLTHRGEFTIASCGECGFRFTNPYPSAEDIHVFYDTPDYTPVSNSKEGLLNKGYHLARRVMLRAKRRLVQRLVGRGLRSAPPRGSNQAFHETSLEPQGGAERSPRPTLLDIGCGTGEFLATMKQAGWSVQGVEPYEPAKNSAIKNFQIPVTDLAGQSSLPDHAYDVITLWHVLEHAHDLHRSMAEISRLLKPGGLVLIGVPNCDSWDAKFYGAHWAAYDTPRHLFHFNPATMRRLATRHNFEVASIHPLFFDPIYIPLLTEKKRADKNVLRGVYAAIRSFIFSLFYPAKCTAIAYVLKSEEKNTGGEQRE